MEYVVIIEQGESSFGAYVPDPVPRELYAAEGHDPVYLLN